MKMFLRIRSPWSRSKETRKNGNTTGKSIHQNRVLKKSRRTKTCKTWRKHFRP